MAGRSRSSIVTPDQVDPAFSCLICESRPYVPGDAEQMPTNSQMSALVLEWVNHRWCYDCDLTLGLTYKYDLAPNGRLRDYNGKMGALIKMIAEDQEEKTVPPKNHVDLSLA